jgi:nicotinamide-nucleotide amidase
MVQQAIELAIGDMLRSRGLNLATAESCTGGLIGHRLTNIAGSSDYFLGGVIAYANPVKMGLLGVRSQTLDEHGAVSRETVQEMAAGVRRALGADIGLAVSGVAGPGGGTPEKPVGLVWIGLSAPQVETERRYLFSGERLSVKEQAAQAALELLETYLQDKLLGDRDRVEDVPLDRREGGVPVDVRARYNAQGQALPVSLALDGISYVVESTGRRWQDGEGEHILVMIKGGKAFELLCSTPGGMWTAREVGKPGPFA